MGGGVLARTTAVPDATPISTSSDITNQARVRKIRGAVSILRIRIRRLTAPAAPNARRTATLISRILPYSVVHSCETWSNRMTVEISPDAATSTKLINAILEYRRSRTTASLRCVLASRMVVTTSPPTQVAAAAACSQSAEDAAEYAYASGMALQSEGDQRGERNDRCDGDEPRGACRETEHSQDGPSQSGAQPRLADRDGGQELTETRREDFRGHRTGEREVRQNRCGEREHRPHTGGPCSEVQGCVVGRFADRKSEAGQNQGANDDPGG